MKKIGWNLSKSYYFMKNAIKKLIVVMRLQKISYRIFDLYAYFFRFVTVSRDGITYSLDLKESVDRGIFLLGWEPLTINWLKSNLKPGDTVIEVGANVGAHSLIISNLISPNGFLYAFEPTNYAFLKLNTNFNLNPLLKNNTELVQLFVSDKDNSKSNSKIRSSWIVNKSDRLADEMDENFQGSVVNLDDFFEGLDKLNLLKIDVDGFDYRVLQGSKKLISIHKPIVFIELGEIDLQKNNNSIEDIINFFSELEYSGILENGEKISSYQQVLAYLESSTHVNGIFRYNSN